MPWDEGLINSLVYNEPDLTQGRVLGYAQAINEALSVAMERDPSIIVLGQGVDDPGSMFGTTKGLDKLFGGERVFDTPLSEEGMMGICTGAAMNGCRPVYFHNRPDFLLLAMNQIVTHAAKYSYLDNGQTSVPMVVWSAIGRGWGSGPQHSQAIQGMLMQVPGIKILMPSNPFDAKGLMIAAIQDNNPVFIFDHRWLMKQKGIVPEGYYTVPIGKGIYRRRGKDLTVVGTSHTLEVAVKALDNLAGENITADVIDLRTIKPLDEAIILESVRKTGKLLVVDTGWVMAGVCAEIGCLVAEKGFRDLKAPVRRVGMPDIPTPAGFTLEQYIYPNAEKVAVVIQELVNY
jgi:acetoin:2,6-dichlorophenolindophenol oxidoreductase subunit beta